MTDIQQGTPGGDGNGKVPWIGCYNHGKMALRIGVNDAPNYCIQNIKRLRKKYKMVCMPKQSRKITLERKLLDS